MRSGVGGIEAHRRPLAGFGQRLEKTSFDFGHGTHYLMLSGVKAESNRLKETF